jgi:hypothetical protein
MPGLYKSPITSGKYYLFTLFIILLFTGCDLVQSDNETDTECYLDRIQFNEFESLNFQTISGGRVYTLTQELIVDGEPSVTASFQFNYKKNSIRVVNRTDPHPINPYMQITLEDDRPVEVIRYFNSVGVILTHDITYPEQNRIRVDLTREASTGDVLYVGYSDYQLDNSGNVVRQQQFRASDDDPESFTTIFDRFYSYDDNPNPQDDLYLPFFANVNFPDTRFFSSNNITSYTENGETFSFDYDYGPRGEVIRQVQPTGVEILFGYANCPLPGE